MFKQKKIWKKVDTIFTLVIILISVILMVSGFYELILSLSQQRYWIALLKLAYVWFCFYAIRINRDFLETTLYLDKKMLDNEFNHPYYDAVVEKLVKDAVESGLDSGVTLNKDEVRAYLESILE